MAHQTYVLVVDDEAELAQLIADFLTLEGFAVDVAHAGDEALECIARRRPSLLLLDHHMPVMDGRAVIEDLRRRQIKLPIVLMTGAADARETAAELGVAAYVPKPMPLPLLLERILAALTAA